MKYDFNTFIKQYTAFIESKQYEEASALLEDYKSFMAQVSDNILDALNSACSQLEDYTGEPDKELDRAIDTQYELSKQYLK
mgnify:CR=1 FL=1